MRRTLPILLCLILAPGMATLAQTAEQTNAKEQDPTDKDAKNWYDRFHFFGDFRLRYEGFDWGGDGAQAHFDDGERNRLRYRLRLNLSTEVTKNVKLAFEVRSGNPNNPISDNQTFDEGFKKDRISIAQASASWAATPWLTVIGGKFSPQKVWTVSDMEWDSDLNPAGAMEVFEWKFDGVVKELGLNLFQFVANESESSTDAYILGGQIVPVFHLGEKNTLTAGMGYESFHNPTSIADLYFDDVLVIDSGYVTNLVDPATNELVSEFRVGSVFAEWQNKSFKRWPITLKTYYYKNFGAKDAVGSILPVDSAAPALTTANSADNDTAYFIRVEAGGYKKPGDVQVRFAVYKSQPDAIFFAYAQSDSRRSSNLNGIRTDVRIGMPMKGNVNVTWYRTEWYVGNDSLMDRWQLDYVFRF